MTISAEQREELKRRAPTPEEVDTLLRDSARLERIEREVRELAEHKEQCADAALAMPDSHNQHKVEAEDYSRQAAALRAIVDTGDEGDEG